MFTTACSNTSSSVSVVSIEKTNTSGNVDTYTITYENGKTYSFTVTNGTNGKDGVDGESYDIDTIYESAVSAGFKGTLLDFLEVYLSYDEEHTIVSTNLALLSAVSIYSNFTGTRSYIYMGRIYTEEVEYSSAGAGVIYSLDKENGDAYIVTNYHVIYDADSNQTNGISEDIGIYLYGYQDNSYKIAAKYYGGSMENDLAILKVEDNQILRSSDAKACEIRDSESIDVGETAIAIGNPEAMGISVTSGIVSVDSEYISMASLDGKSENTQRVIRIDTAVNGGNSGGGLFDKNGRLIGIVNAKVSDTSIENIAFAIPSNVAIYIADNIINNEGNLKKLTLGITLASKNAKGVLNSNQKVDIIEDVIIEEVETGSLAESLGLKVDDQIISIQINDRTPLMLSRLHQIIDYSYLIKQQDEITLTILSDNTQKQIVFTVTEEHVA